MSLLDAVRSVLRQNYATFRGRARRSEFWWWYLANLIISLLATVALSVVFTVLVVVLDVGQASPMLVVALAWLITTWSLLLPTWAVGVRRLHDTGRSGWWLLLGALPFGGLVILFFAVQDGEPGENRFGPDPKGLPGAYA